MIIPLLFDTGTNRNILLNTGPGSLPPGLVFSVEPENLARLDGKPIEMIDSGYLRYASSDDVKFGNSASLTMPFRVYGSGKSEEMDFQGAIAPLLFGTTHVIEVHNSKSIIKLIPNGNWTPDHNDLKLPLKKLPRGIFIPLSNVDQTLWFQVDTGFSGELAVTPESQLAMLGPEDSNNSNNQEMLFTGWGRKTKLTPCQLSLIVMDEHDDSRSPTNMGGYLQFPQGHLLPPNYFQDVTSLDVGGIVGAGFLADHNYAIDLSNGWLYILFGFSK